MTARFKTALMVLSLAFVVIIFLVYINNVTTALFVYGLSGDVLFEQNMMNIVPMDKKQNTNYRVVAVKRDNGAVSLVCIRKNEILGREITDVQSAHEPSEAVYCSVTSFINPASKAEMIEKIEFAVVKEIDYLPLEDADIPSNTAVAQLYRNGYVIIKATYYDNTKLEVLKSLIG